MEIKEISLIKELARIDDLKEISNLENLLEKNEKMFKNAFNSENEESKERLEIAKKKIEEILEKENELDLEEPLNGFIKQRFEKFQKAKDDFASACFEVLIPFDKYEIDESKIFDSNALDKKDISFEGIMIDNESIQLVKEEFKRNQISIENKEKEEMHITKKFRKNKEEPLIFNNDDLGKEQKIEISKYGELVKENVKLADGSIKNKVLANQGLLVSKIDGKDAPENTHITVSNNKEKMIVNVNGKDKKVQIGAPVETKDCDFNKDFNLTLTGKTAVFDLKSNAFFKYEDREELLRKKIIETIENLNETRVSLEV